MKDYWLLGSVATLVLLDVLLLILWEIFDPVMANKHGGSQKVHISFLFLSCFKYIFNNGSRIGYGWLT